MGHHIFMHDGKGLPMADFDVALVKHFLMEGASRKGPETPGYSTFVGLETCDTADLGICATASSNGV
jgi:hypothetical protein